MYASQWFITLFSYSFPRDLVTRIWDIYFLEGEKILFRVALALLKEREKELIQLRFEPLFAALKEFRDETLDPNYILPKALKLKVRTRSLYKAISSFLLYTQTRFFKGKGQEQVLSRVMRLYLEL